MPDESIPDDGFDDHGQRDVHSIKKNLPRGESFGEKLG